MAKKQTFGDKVLKSRAEAKKMAKIVVATKKENGHYSFQQRIVEADRVKEEIKAARS